MDKRLTDLTQRLHELYVDLDQLAEDTEGEVHQAANQLREAMADADDLAAEIREG
jgi:hypothetical protein